MGMYYGDTLYKSTTIADCARAFLKDLPGDVDILVSGGSSGCALASAMLALSGDRVLKHCAFYSKGHESHRGRAKEYSGYRAYPAVDGDEGSACCVVDDLIDTGKTVRSLLSRIPSGCKRYVLVGEYCDFDNAEVVKLEDDTQCKVSKVW